MRDPHAHSQACYADAVRLEVKDSASASIERGHPWVFRDALRKTPARLDAGAVVELADGRGKFLGRGLWDPDSPIAVRIHERSARITRIKRRIRLHHILDQPPAIAAQRAPQRRNNADSNRGLQTERIADRDRHFADLKLI